MSRNAVAAFRGLGFDSDDVAALGCATGAAGTWASGGRPILTIPEDEATREAVALIGVHRRRLHQALLRHAQDAGVRIVPDTPVTTVVTALCIPSAPTTRSEERRVGQGGRW